MDKAVEARIKTLSAVLPKPALKAVKDELKAAEGDWSAAVEKLKGKLPDESLKTVILANSLADWSGDNIPLVKALVEEPKITSLRDVALRYNVEGLAKFVDPKDVPTTITATTLKKKVKEFAVSLNRKLFEVEPNAVLERMVRDAEIPIADASDRAAVAQFFANQPDFNIGTTSVNAAIKSHDALRGVADERRPVVIAYLKTIQRVYAISPTAEALSALLEHGLSSARRVAEMSESKFVSVLSKEIGADLARQVHTNAVNAHIRNETALMKMREATLGIGLTVIGDEQ